MKTYVVAISTKLTTPAAHWWSESAVYTTIGQWSIKAENKDVAIALATLKEINIRKKDEPVGTIVEPTGVIAWDMDDILK
jgi:hypothetical protein